MNTAEELQKLQQLHASGGLSDEEFAQAKAKLLAPSGMNALLGSGNTEEQSRQWAMFLHLSQLAGILVPLAGLIVPILIWQIKKKDLPEIDAHGKVVMNWIISEIIYFVVSAILIVVVVGFLMVIVLMILGIIFPIIGGVKANNGEVWKYPLSISFFK
jgi:uncharacterized protein